MMKRFAPEDGKPANGFTLIVVTPDVKVRYSGGPLHNNREYYADHWRLYRRDVSSLTDDEWYAAPTGWKDE